MKTEDKETEKKQKTRSEEFSETTREIKVYNTGTQDVIKSSRETGGTVVDAMQAAKDVGSNVLAFAWGKDPATEIKELKKEKGYPDDLNYDIFLRLKFLSVTQEIGKKIRTRYGNHKFEASYVKGLFSNFYIWTSTSSSNFMKNMEKPDVGDGAIPILKKAKDTVDAMTGVKEMAAVLWVMNLREGTLFELTPEFSAYCQKARRQGRLVAEDDADEFSFLLKGQGAVYELVKEEEALRKARAEAELEILKKRIENDKARQLKRDSEPLKKEEIDVDTRLQSYKAQKQEELASEQKARQRNNSNDSQSKSAVGDIENSNIATSPKFGRAG